MTAASTVPSMLAGSPAFTIDVHHSWAAWFFDPSGNCLAVVQPK